jgi:hypothetical protein
MLHKLHANIVQHQGVILLLHSDHYGAREGDFEKSNTCIDGGCEMST